MAVNLKGKICILTGALGGIGISMAKDLEKLGIIVIGVDKDDVKNPELKNYYSCDLGNKEEIALLYNKLDKDFDHIDFLINNAAISNFNKPLQDVTDIEIDSVIDVNLKGPILMCQEYIKRFKGQNGRIINIASTRYKQNEEHWELYGSTKGGLVSLTSSLCISLSNKNITVNAISPGWIEAKDYKNLTEMDHKQHPCGRVGKPEDITRAAAFLLDENSDFINGINLIIDGGMTKKMIYV